MDIKEIVRALRGTWWVPLLGLLLGGLVAMGITLAATPVYTSHTQLFVSTTDSSTTSDVFQGNQFAEKRIASYAELLTSRELASRVVAEMDLDVTPDQLASKIAADPVAGTVVLDVSVTDESAQRAQLMAAGVAGEFIKAVEELETPAGSAASPVKVTVFGVADLPGSPSAPRPALNIALGAVLGLLVGAATSIVRAKLDRSVKDPEEAAELAGAPVIAVILRDDELKNDHHIEPHSTSRSAEAFRQLQTNLQFLDVDSPPRVLMVSSAVPAEGKTTVAVNLALSLADAGQRVVILEADLRRPRVTSYLGLVAGAGLTNILTGQARIEDVEQFYGDSGLVVIGAGPVAPNPAQLLASGSMGALLDELRKTYDYVILDAPPLLPVADATGLAVLADGVLLSVRHGSTTKDQLARTRSTLDRVGARTVGTVLNIVPVRDEVSSTYGYDHDYAPVARPATAG
ncbi:MAG: Capsular polysaccharide synthesis enzyme CpsD, exopolysaccharide synthesis [uncultured Blastococcus sp.]|uniref:non-specific protein-tyrosine kinase n=1 Tax=uncultured Blastococcus sp. TaxID=217144 RepID=A0A6J4ISW7_9ACTN|nr:MAG: Capsular polysaccharide synthesis enzyme CpsD, exopolysaccharide synthesis [uncultured Blastococcus sp.]